jgi:carboxymethylenebutenolidase
MRKNYLRREVINLKCKDGKHISVYKYFNKRSTLNINLIVLHEVFGVNKSIKNICENFAGYGFTVFSPSLFDRIKKNISLGYSEEERQEGLTLIKKVSEENILLDIKSLIKELPSSNKKFILGYCFGGSITWKCAAHLSNISGAICYYGPDIINNINQKLLCPVLMHFGERDLLISSNSINIIKKKYPLSTVYTYHSGHGFANPDRSQYDLTSSLLAEKHTIQFIIEKSYMILP